MRMMKKKLPVFKTMDEWSQSPILTDPNHGLYPKMSVLSEKYRVTRTFKERHPLRKETEELAGTILREIGNPLPPVLDNVLAKRAALVPDLKGNTIYRYNPEFIRDLENFLGRSTLDHPFTMMPGEVSGQMAVDYIVKTTGLPLEITAGDKVTRNALESTNIKIMKDNKMWQVLAETCNSAKVDLDISPIGSGIAGRDPLLPPKIMLVHLGPWSKLHYQPSMYGVSVSGSVIESEGDWSYVSGSENQQESSHSSGNGYWIPKSLCLKCPVSKQNRQVDFSRNELPFKDPETGWLLRFDKTTNNLVFSEDPSAEKTSRR